MSQRTERWYVLGQEGDRYVILGWSKTLEAADARVTKLTRQGKYGNALRATDRASARKRAKQIFGINVAYLQKVPVRMLYKACALQVRCFDQPGWAMSDCCNVQAWFVVQMPQGQQHYRCAEHKSVTYLPEHPFYATHGGHGHAQDYVWQWST